MTTPSNAAAEARIRQLMEERTAAVRAKDVEALVAHHAPGVLTFDLIEPLQYSGVEAVRKRALQWFSSYDGPMVYEIRDLRVTAGEEVAFCHGLHHVAGKSREGTEIGMWWRATECWRNIGGNWMVVHAHSSVPFDMTSGKASLAGKP